MKLGNCHYVFIVKPLHLSKWAKLEQSRNCYSCNIELTEGMLCQLKANGGYRSHKRCIPCALRLNILTEEDIKDLKIMYYREMDSVKALKESVPLNA